MLKLKKNKTLTIVIAMIMMVGLMAGNLNIASANPVQHEVTFHANGGKFADGKKELKKSFDEGTAWSAATANIEHPKKDGSNFLGWSLASSSTKADLNEAHAGVNKGDTDVYAVYEKSTTSISITFDPNGGEGEPDPVSIDKGASLGELLPMGGMYKEGHILAGWATKNDAVTPDVTPETTFDKNTTLYAVWEKIEDGAEVSVTFSANGGKFGDNSTVKTVKDIKRGTAMGEKFLAEEPTPNASANPEENKFLGWAASQSATAPDFDKDTVVTGTMTVYAVYGKGVNKDNKKLGIKKEMIQVKTVAGDEVSLKFKPFPTNELNAGDKVVGYKIYRGTSKDNVEGIGEVNTVKPDADGNISYTDKKNLEPSKTYLYAVSAIVERENVKIEGAAEDLVGYWHASADAPKLSVEKGKVVVDTTPASAILEGIKSVALERADYPKGEFKPVAGAEELAPNSKYTDASVKTGAYLYRVTIFKQVDGVVYSTKSEVAGAAVLGKVNKKTFKVKIKKVKGKYVATVTWKGVKGAMTFELQKATAKNAKKLKKFKGIKFSKMKAVDKKALKKKWFVQYRIRAVFKYGNAKFVSGWQLSKKIKLK